MLEVHLVDHTSNPEGVIGCSAGICYDSDTSSEANERRVKHILNLKHLSCLRFAYATFHIKNISRTCSHQLVRHPHLSFLQRSQRYCNEQDVRFVTPVGLYGKDAEFIYQWTELESKAKKLYKEGIRLGMRKEDARFILPQSCTTELLVTGNFQAWKDFLDRRNTPKAQWEIKIVAAQVQDLLSDIAPNIFTKENNEDNNPT